MTCHHKLRMTESIDPLTKTVKILLPLVSGEGKRRNEFVEWHVAWFAE